MNGLATGKIAIPELVTGIASVIGIVLIGAVFFRYVTGKDETAASVVVVAVIGLALLAFPIFNNISVSFGDAKVDLSKFKETVQEAQTTVQKAQATVQEAKDEATEIKQRVNEAQETIKDAANNAVKVQSQVAEAKLVAEKNFSELKVANAEVAEVIKKFREEYPANSPGADRVPEFIGSVFFDEGKAIVDPLPLQSEKIKSLLSLNPGSKVLLMGYADAEGNEAENQKLAESRAEAVREQLKKAGVPSERTDVRPQGEVASWFSGDENEQAYRRVDIWIPK